MKKLQLFDQNYGLSPLQKCQFWILFKSMFILSRKACFLTRTSPNTFSGCILHKTKRSQNFQFLKKNHGLTRLQKCQFCAFLKPMFLLFRKNVCYIKRRKSFFHDLFSRSMTREYMGLPGVTGGYKGLQGVKGGYKELQGATGGDNGLQGFTKDYRNFFLTRTFPDTFSWSILHKNQSWRNL